MAELIPSRGHGATHGLSRSAEFGVWWTMRQRCENPKRRGFADYGGRGIRVCGRWSDFAAFLADMGPRPSKSHSIDRIDVDGDYTPDNCRWATRHEQMRNRRDNVVWTIDGETAVQKDWARRFGIHPNTLRLRVQKGMSVEDALKTKAGSIVRAKSGIRGVFHHPGRPKPWQARAHVAGRYKSLGYFASKEEAAAAVAAFKEQANA